MKILTFYSYKGGVGRSMALANVAEILYRQGKKVVIIDWDLEAPGLESYFCTSQEEIKKVESHPGLIDLLQSYKRLYPRLGSLSKMDLENQLSSVVTSFLIQSSNNVVKEIEIAGLVEPTFLSASDKVFVTSKLAKFSKGGDPKDLYNFITPMTNNYLQDRKNEFFDKLKNDLPPFLPLLQLLRAPLEDPGGVDCGLWLLSAGMRSDAQHYSKAVQDFSWSEFYSSYNGELYFEWFRTELSNFADYVLIDTRTGVTEMGGVCTQHLGDVLCFITAPNPQNVKGIRDMIKSVSREEIRSLRKDRPLKLVVVPARIDSTELHNRNNFQSNFIMELTGLLGEEQAVSCWSLRIPYVAYYTYFDRLVVGARTQNATQLRNSYMAAELEEAYEKLAAYLTGVRAGDDHGHNIASIEMLRSHHARPYKAAESQLFFGRGRELKDLMYELNLNHIAVVCGSRMSGKTSFLNACVIPEMLKLDPSTEIIKIDYSSESFETLEQKISGVTANKKNIGNIFLAIDNLSPTEGGFTSETIHALMSLFTNYGGLIKTVIIVCDLYADELMVRVQIPGNKITLARLEESAIRRVLAEPLMLAGLSFEPGLIDRIVKDLENAEPQLYLLQQTLKLMLEEMDSDLLKHSRYDSFNGVNGVLANYYEKCTEPFNDRNFLLRVISRLVDADTGSLKSIGMEEIDYQDREILQRYILNHLVAIKYVNAHVTSPFRLNAHVTLMSEKLPLYWRALKNVVASNTDFLRWRQGIATKMSTQEINQPFDLLRETVFGPKDWSIHDSKIANQWLASRPDMLSRREVTFVRKKLFKKRLSLITLSLVMLTAIAIPVLDQWNDQLREKKSALAEVKLFEKKLALLNAQSGPLRLATTCMLSSSVNTYNSEFIARKKDSLIRACVFLESKFAQLEDSISRSDQVVEKLSRALSPESINRLRSIDSLERLLLDRTSRLKTIDNDLAKIPLRKDSSAIETAIFSLYAQDKLLRDGFRESREIAKDYESMNRLVEVTRKPSIVMADSSSWFKKGYYLRFEEVKLLLIKVSGEQISIDVTISDSLEKPLKKLIIEVLEGKTSWISSEDFEYAITLDKIGRAGRNPFTPAAYVTFVKFRKNPEAQD